MSAHRVTGRVALASLFGAILLPIGVAVAQTAAPPTTTPTAPDVVTPPGGIARGVVPPPHDVDPAIVTPPPTAGAPSMPVIKPPNGAR